MSQPGFVPVRQLVLVDLLGLILAVRPGERAVVGVDGVDGAGKTHLAGELLALNDQVGGREVVGVCMDGFYRPRAEWDAAGTCPEVFYHGSFDYAAFRRKVLTPFRAGREITPAVHDVVGDTPVYPDPVEPSDDALLLVDGIFLRRPELHQEWDATLLVLSPTQTRYAGAQRLYLQQARVNPPTWILDNSDLRRPVLLEPDPEDPQWFG